MQRVTSGLIVSAFVFLASCSGGTEPATNPNSGSIDTYFATVPAWNNLPASSSIVPLDTVYLNELLNDGSGNSMDYLCPRDTKAATGSFPSLLSPQMAASAATSALYPGAIISGNAFDDGTIQLYALRRAPLTLIINQALSNTSTVVQTPNAGTIQQAIADFQLASGTPGLGTQTVQYVGMSSFEQAQQALGVSAKYDDGVGDSISAGIDLSSSRSHSSQSALVVGVEQLFTVSFEDDLVPLASGFFDPSVTAQDIASQGVGSNDIPLFVASVTYGRALFFSSQSNSAVSADSLAAFLNGTYAKVSAGVTLSIKDSTEFHNLTNTISEFGGTQNAGNAVVSTGDWRLFFTPMTAGDAVPLAFTLKTVKANAGVHQPAGLAYDYSVAARGGCKEPVGYHMTVDFLRSAWTGQGYTDAYLYAWGDSLYGTGADVFLVNGLHLYGDNGAIADDNNAILVTTWDQTPGSFLRVRSRVTDSGFEDTMRWTYPYPDWKQATNFSRSVPYFSQIARFDYVVQKTPYFR